MASRPFFDPTGRGRWRISWFDGTRWVKSTLGPHPAAWDRARPPTKPPAGVVRAAREYEDREAAIRSGAADPPAAAPVSAEAHLAAYEAAYAAGHAENSRKALGVALLHFRATLESRGVTRLDQVTEAVARAHLEARLLAAKRSTVCTERSYLAPIFRRAADEGLIPRDPFARARVPGKRVEEAPPYWTREQLAALAAAAEGEWTRALVLLGANTGIRGSGLLHLEWSDVDLARGVVVVRAGLAANKGRRRHEVPLTATARRVLASLPRVGKYVLGNPRTGRPVASRQAYERIQRAAIRAGLPEDGRYLHTLRHTFASHAVLAGVPLAVVSKWLGHASINMTLRYAHLSPRDSQEQAGRFDLPA